VNAVIVIGLGNLLMSDEGVGIRVVQALSSRAATYPGVDFADLGTAGMRVLHAITGRRHAVFVDCAFMGQPPGTVQRFTPDAVRSLKSVAGLSLHEGDLLETLELARRLGEVPERIVIFGIEPLTITPGMELSPPVAARLDDCVAQVARELRCCGRPAIPAAAAGQRSC